MPLGKKSMVIRPLKSSEKIPQDLINLYAESLGAWRRSKLRKIINPVVRKATDLHYAVIAPNTPPAGQMLGFAIAKVVELPQGIDFGDKSRPSPAKRYVDLVELFVHPDYQRQGLGSELIRTISNEAEGRGATHLRIYRMHRPSVNLFLKLAGMSPQSGRANLYWIRPLRSLAERFLKRRPDGIIELHSTYL
jgi:GNAT superfamily N-acetyltransferase